MKIAAPCWLDRAPTEFRLLPEHYTHRPADVKPQSKHRKRRHVFHGYGLKLTAVVNGLKREENLG
jgi:hypothetical protein